MRIHDDHLYHGAALIQIAEHEQFTAINSLKVGKEISRVAYCVNNDIAVYFKYATAPKGKYDEYVFTFNEDHITDLEKIHAKNAKTFIALICVEGRQICCLKHEDFSALRRARALDAKKQESTLTVLVTAPTGKGLRVYVNAHATKNTTLGKTIIAKNRFPSVLFED